MNAHVDERGSDILRGLKQLKGVGCEELVHAYFLLKGYETFRPSSPLSAWDMGVTVDGQNYTVQVKCANIIDGKKIKVDVRKGSAKDRHYSLSDFDVIAVVVPSFSNPKIAFIPRDKFNIAFMLWITREITFVGRRKAYLEPLFFDDFTDFSNAIGKRSNSEPSVDCANSLTEVSA